MNGTGSPGGHEKAIQGILRYLIEHPDAKDTVEGIMKWWRLEGQLEWKWGAIQEALDVLVLKGWLVKREVTPSKKIYGMNKDRLEEIGNFLQQKKGTDKRAP